MLNRPWITGVWYRSVEKLSLGGLLVLRQEMELLAKQKSGTRMRLVLDGAFSAAEIKMAKEAFRSDFSREVTYSRIAEESWPSSEEIKRKGFSYQSLSRAVKLWRTLGRQPVLRWPRGLISAARRRRRRYAGKLYTVHLKRTSGEDLRESNASQRMWARFLRSRALPGRRDFLLLGKDEASDEIRSIPGIHVAAELHMPLSAQLCMVGVSDGFLGMASGMCQAAIFSQIPYVIFKHPKHHPSEMRRELGNSDAFPFALAKQKLWRRLDTASNLEKALTLLEGP